MPETTRYVPMSPAAVLTLARFLQRANVSSTSAKAGPLAEAYAAIVKEADEVLNAERSERHRRLEVIPLPGLESVTTARQTVEVTAAQLVLADSTALQDARREVETWLLTHGGSVSVVDDVATGSMFVTWSPARPAASA